MEIEPLNRSSTLVRALRHSVTALLLVLIAFAATGCFGLGDDPATNNSSSTATAVRSIAQGAPAATYTTVLPPTPSPTLVPFTGDPVSPLTPPSQANVATRYYTETGHYLGGEFLSYYKSMPNAAALFGLPITEAFAEQLSTGVYRVQYFERARLEAHPELPASQRVQLGVIAPALLAGRTFDRLPTLSSTANRVYFPETAHTISNGFLEYWRANGGLRVFGFPLSEEIGEDGITVQYFERARMEYHTGLEGTGFAVQLSPIGYYALKNDHYTIPMGLLVRLNPPVLAEGHSAVVEVAATEGMTVTGLYEGRSLLFKEDSTHGIAWAMLGAVPFADLGPRPFSITLQDAVGGTKTVTRTLQIVQYPFPSESLQFDAATSKLLDPALTSKESNTLAAIFSGRTRDKLWDGKFRMPLDGKIRITSIFATRRCYSCPDGSKPTTYHGGMDMAAPEGSPVHAPAAGIVVLAEKLAVRGNVVIIDHGMGVFSLFAHNSQFIAKVGQRVEKGEVVSLSGNTGLSNGPHLHWELHVSGPPVDPVEWVNRAMP